MMKDKKVFCRDCKYRSVLYSIVGAPPEVWMCENSSNCSIDYSGRVYANKSCKELNKNLDCKNYKRRLLKFWR